MPTAEAKVVATKKPGGMKKIIGIVVGLFVLVGIGLAVYYILKALKRRKETKNAQVLAEAQREAHLAAIARDTREVTGTPGPIAYTGVFPNEFHAEELLTGDVIPNLPVGSLIPRKDILVRDEVVLTHPPGHIELEVFTKIPDYKLQTTRIIGQFSLPFDACHAKAVADPACLAFASSHKAGVSHNNCELYGANRVTGGHIEHSSLHDYYEKPLLPLC